MTPIRDLLAAVLDYLEARSEKRRVDKLCAELRARLAAHGGDCRCVDCHGARFVLYGRTADEIPPPQLPPTYARKPVTWHVADDLDRAALDVAENPPPGYVTTALGRYVSAAERLGDDDPETIRLRRLAQLAENSERCPICACELDGTECPTHGTVDG